MRLHRSLRSACGAERLECPRRAGSVLHRARESILSDTGAKGKRRVLLAILIGVVPPSLTLNIAHARGRVNLLIMDALGSQRV